ncbi:MAG: PIG-L deacetylase family protein [Candidatus Promineifilaceae bacterium]|nr:PIG-L deacetylase family protein [Candidatus Promineifilaceae bacterium]
MAKRRLMAVLAHPDDESFGPGGTLARYADEGADVHVVICTDGAAGSVIEAYADARERLAEIRRQELEGATGVLGVQLHMLGYRDSGYIGDPAGEHPEAFVNVNEEEAAARIVHLIRSVRPQVVITHDETGGYFHPDHIKAHAVTVRAFHAAGDGDALPRAGAPYQPQRLYFTAISGRRLRLYTLSMRLRGRDPTRVGRNNDIDLTRLGRPRGELHGRINIDRYWKRKQEASAQHESQGGGTGGFGRSLPVWLRKWLLSTEYFVRAYPSPEKGVWEDDLFAGVKIEEK